MQYIFNADDFGRTATVNEAIVYGFQKNLLSRTTVMVAMPSYENAKALAKENGFWNRVGLHLNITDGIPLTEDIKRIRSFTDDNGRFNGKIFKSKRLALVLTCKEKKTVQKEIDAQIERFLSDGFTLKHADSHGHVHTFPSMQRLVVKRLKKYGFESVRIIENVRNSRFFKRLYKKLINIRFYRFNKTNEQATQHFGAYKEVLLKERMFKLQNARCEVMLHPNIYDGDIQIGQGLHYDDIQQRLL